MKDAKAEFWETNNGAGTLCQDELVPRQSLDGSIGFLDVHGPVTTVNFDDFRVDTDIEAVSNSKGRVVWVWSVGRLGSGPGPRSNQPTWQRAFAES